MVSLLDVRPEDRVLEVGFGPGIALGELAARAARGRVYGVDHSAVMVERAGRRTRAAADRIELVHTSVDRLPPFGEPLDAVLAVNNAGFWPDPPARLRELRGLLRPGGRIALASRPAVSRRRPGHHCRAARELQDLLTEAGFAELRVETLDLDPPVACVLGVNPR